jgi:FkbM family methyltransferase
VSPELRLPSIAAILPSLPRLRIVDVGAMWTGPDADRYARLEKALPCEIIGFEPVAAEYHRLVALSRPHHRYFPYMIGDGSARIFYECRAPFTSSLFEPDLAMAENFEHLAECFQIVRTHEVRTMRLDDIAEIGDVDFLKVDVQGAEILVFQGALECLKTALIVDVEVDFIPLYKNQPLFADVDSFLRARGFTLHHLQHYGLTFKPTSVERDGVAAAQQTAWGDAVYVRDFPAFDALEPPALLKLAAILHENYRSCGLAARALGAHDRKMRTSLQSAYARLMASHI